MSGRVQIKDDSGQLIRIDRIEIDELTTFRSKVVGICNGLSEIMPGLFGQWKKALVSRTIFTGSLSLFMTSPLSLEEIKKEYGKDSLGDLDILVNKRNFNETLLVPGMKLGDFIILGKKKTHMIHLIVTDGEKNWQMDINSIPFWKGWPLDFYTRLSTTSPLEDMKIGLPGFIHKYLFMACVKARAIWCDLEGMQKGEEFNKYTFSVQYGVRDAFYRNERGLLKPIASNARTYMTDLDHIAEFIFGDKNADMYSFVGLMKTVATVWKDDKDKIRRMTKWFIQYVTNDLVLTEEMKAKIINEIFQKEWMKYQ